MPSSRRLRAALLAAGTGWLLAGCGALAGAPAQDGRQAAASFYPLAWVTEQVAGDRWDVTNLTTAGGEPHDLELSIAATSTLAGSDLVVFLRGFQPAVDEAVESTAEGTTLDAADVVDLESPPEVEGPDPHFWQDPARMALLAEAVGEELGALDEAHAAEYRDRAARLVDRLEALDQEYADGLASCRRDVVVVSHDAFGYLGKYGLRVEPIAGLSPDAEPTPAALGRLGGLIREERLTTVFSERLASPAMAETLASDLGVRTGVLDPVEGLTDQTADEDYLSLMRANLAALREANGC